MGFSFSPVKQFGDRWLVHKVIHDPDSLYPFTLHPLKCCPGYVVKTEPPARREKIESREQATSFKELTQKLPTSLLLTFYWQKTYSRSHIWLQRRWKMKSLAGKPCA